MNHAIISSNEETKTAPSESTQNLRGQVRELGEKLAFAHETIAIMEEEHRSKVNGPSEPSAYDLDVDDNADKISEGSNPDAKMVDRMIS